MIEIVFIPVYMASLEFIIIIPDAKGKVKGWRAKGETMVCSVTRPYSPLTQSLKMIAQQGPLRY